jgi:plasmid stabilization system protein ParE
MAPKNVEFHEEAAREFLAAVDWYLSRNEAVASRFALQVTRAVRLIVEAPQRWPSNSRDTRKFVLRRFPFLVVYRELTDVIQVLAVAHAHRRPGYWKNRR